MKSLFNKLDNFFTDERFQRHQKLYLIPFAIYGILKYICTTLL